jgi:hypothetical protein
MLGREGGWTGRTDLGAVLMALRAQLVAPRGPEPAGQDLANALMDQAWDE